MKSSIQTKNQRQDLPDKRHVFILGAKSLGAYGGYETFVNKLTEYHQDCPEIQYHIACKANGNGSRPIDQLKDAVPIARDAEGNVTSVLYQGAKCFSVKVPEIGAAQAIYYDLASLNQTIEYIKKNRIQNPIVYILACRIGPFISHYAKILHKLGGKLFVNPDGHEWKRMKWNLPIRKYWKLSEKLMVKNADLIVCDSVNIESYIHSEYDHKGYNHSSPKTTYIAYGSETDASSLDDSHPELKQWYNRFDITPDNYYLAVGRFVPENNYEIMIREFMKSKSRKDFVLITNANAAFQKELDEKLHFSNDPRIKFVGTLYDQELLMKVRENAFAYLHGHEVGGTNPSLLEALSTTPLNLLLDVGFNREVALDSALYWNKEEGNLASLITRAENELTSGEIQSLSEKAKKRIREAYSWERVAGQYCELFSADQ